MRRTRLCATAAIFLAIAGGLLLHAQSRAVPADLKFDVASFKPSEPGGRGGGIRPAPGGERYIATNATIKLMLQVAYLLKPEQVVGGPDWLDTERFEMNAKAGKPSNIDELHTMLMNLLVERCKLKSHIEKRELPIYAMTADKSGAKLTPHEAQNVSESWIDLATEEPPFKMKLTATACAMDYLAFRLSQVVDRPVVNQTGIKGTHDFTLKFTRELPPGITADSHINGQPIDISGPNLFEAMRQQLGLRLDRTKGAVDTLVIDHIEKPTEN